MSFRTNAVKVQAFAGAMFGVQVGTTTMAQINADITSSGGLANALNAYYTSSFGNATTASVAATVAANLGLTGDALASGTAYITAQLNGAAAGARGSVISTILDQFAGLASDATFGAAATAYNAKIATAVAYTGTTNVAIGTVVAANSVFTLSTGTDSPAGTDGNDTFLGTAATTGGTFNAADVINGGNGTDVLNLTLDILAANSVSGATTNSVETINVRNVSGQAQTIAAGNFTGATSFTSDRSVGQLDLTGLVAGQAVGVAGNGSVTNGDFNFTHGATVASGTINISGGTTAGAITQIGAGITSNTINSSGAANTVGVITLSGTVNKSLTINAASPLAATSIGGLTAGATITVSGDAAATATNVGVTLGALDADVTTLNAGGLTVGGVSATLNASTTIAVTGGAGNDRITTGAALTTGTVNAGAGSADRLTLAADTHVNSLTLGNKYSGFEVVGLAAGATQDLGLLATNNTLTGLILAGSATVTNVNAATAGNVTVTASSTPSLTVVGSLNPGQIDTVNFAVNDSVAAVSTFTLTAPTLSGVEILGIAATDNATVTSLGNALALTNVNISGAAATSVTTGAIALQTNFNVNASTSTGDVTFNATGATTNGFSFTGGSGINLVTGGSQVFTANLAASAAKADVITLTNATGGTTAMPNVTIAGFANSATVLVGDRIEVMGTAAVQANIVTATATGITNLTGTVNNGIITFAGSAAATATLANKIDAAASANFAGALDEVIAFEHAGNTYIVSQQGTADAFNAGTDLLIQLTGVVGVTALSATASGATTVWVS
jgi:hypothetical protein